MTHEEKKGEEWSTDNYYKNENNTLKMYLNEFKTVTKFINGIMDNHTLLGNITEKEIEEIKTKLETIKHY